MISPFWAIAATLPQLPASLQASARRELALESTLSKLDKYHLLILDDIAYVSKDQAETSVLLELIETRYERRSMLITANQPFGAPQPMDHGCRDSPERAGRGNALPEPNP